MISGFLPIAMCVSVLPKWAPLTGKMVLLIAFWLRLWICFSLNTWWGERYKRAIKRICFSWTKLQQKIETILSNDKQNDSHEHQAPVITNIKIYHNFLKKRFLSVNQNTIVCQLRIHTMRWDAILFIYDAASY